MGSMLEKSHKLNSYDAQNLNHMTYLVQTYSGRLNSEIEYEQERDLDYLKSNDLITLKPFSTRRFYAKM